MRKKMTHKLSAKDREEIVKLIEAGFSPTDVARNFGVSRVTIYNVLKKHKLSVFKKHIKEVLDEKN